MPSPYSTARLTNATWERSKPAHFAPRNSLQLCISRDSSNNPAPRNSCSFLIREEADDNVHPAGYMISFHSTKATIQVQYAICLWKGGSNVTILRLECTSLACRGSGEMTSSHGFEREGKRDDHMIDCNACELLRVESVRNRASSEYQRDMDGELARKWIS